MLYIYISLVYLFTTTSYLASYDSTNESTYMLGIIHCKRNCKCEPHYIATAIVSYCTNPYLQSLPYTLKFSPKVFYFVDGNLGFFKPGAPGFLKLILCGLSVCVRVCVCECPLSITSGVMWRDIDLI